MKIRRLACSRVTLLEGRPTTQSVVDAPLVVVGGESIQLAMEVEAIPEEDPVQILGLSGVFSSWEPDESRGSPPGSTRGRWLPPAYCTNP
jgi:hypothetical protein